MVIYNKRNTFRTEADRPHKMSAPLEVNSNVLIREGLQRTIRRPERLVERKTDGWKCEWLGQVERK